MSHNNEDISYAVIARNILPQYRKKPIQKSRFQGKATWVCVVAGYRNKMFIYQNIKIQQICIYQPVDGTLQIVVMDSTLSQILNVTVHRDIYKLSLENHFLDLDVNGNVLLDIGLKELVRKIKVYTDLSWVVFGSCGVVF